MKLENELKANTRTVRLKAYSRALDNGLHALEHLRTFEESCVSRIDKLIEEASLEEYLDIDKELVYRQYLIALRKFYQFTYRKELLKEEFIQELSLALPESLSKNDLNKYLNIYLEILKSIVLPHVRKDTTFSSIASNILHVRHYLKVLDGRTDTEVGKRLSMPNDPLKLIKAIIYDVQSLIHSKSELIPKDDFRLLAKISYLILHLFDIDQYFDHTKANSIAFQELNYAFRYIIIPHLRQTQCDELIDKLKLIKVLELCKVNGRNLKKTLQKKIPGLSLENAIPVIQNIDYNNQEKNFIDSFVGVHMLKGFNLEQKQELWRYLKQDIISNSGQVLIADDFLPHCEDIKDFNDKIDLFLNSYGESISDLIKKEEFELAKYELQKLLIEINEQSNNKDSLYSCIRNLKEAGFKDFEVVHLEKGRRLGNKIHASEELRALITSTDTESMLNPNYQFGELLNEVYKSIDLSNNLDLSAKWVRTKLTNDNIPKHGGVYVIMAQA